MRANVLFVSLVGATLMATPILAASDHSGGEGKSAGMSMDTPFGRPGDLKKVVRVIQLSATEINFNLHALTFNKGETVKFVLTNKGEQNHELTIGDEAMEMEHREMMAKMGSMSHEEMDKTMPGHKMYGNSIDTKPGEKKELVWQFTKPGTFEFACNYPGHAEVGMEGKIVVK